MRLAKVFQIQQLYEGASDYEAILKNFPYDLIPSDNLIFVRERFKDELRWAKETLKRPDRVIWWLKFIKFVYYTAFIKNAPKKFQIDPDAEPEPDPPVPNFAKAMIAKTPAYNDYIVAVGHINTTVGSYKHRFAHYMGIDDPRIQSYHWTHETPGDLDDKFKKWEDEYAQQEGRRLAPDASHTVIMKLGDLVWLNLNKAACADEGQAGRHCGNSPRRGSNDRILSLRRLVKGGKQEVCLTFVMEEDGFLGERKGFANNNPDPKYHRAIVELLKQPFIKGMKGGRWATSNDFKLTDLSPELAEELYQARPDYFTFWDVLKIFKDNKERFWAILAAQSPKGIPDELLFRIKDEKVVPLAELVRFTIDHGNHAITYPMALTHLGEQDDGVAKLLDLKIRNLTPDYIIDICKNSQYTSSEIVKKYIELGSDTHLTMVQKLSFLGMEDDYSQKWLHTEGKDLDKKQISEMATMIGSIHTNIINLKIPNIKALTHPLTFLRALISVGNNNIDGLLMNFHHSRNAASAEVRKKDISDMIEIGCDMNPLTALNIIHMFGIDSPLIRQFLLSGRITMKQLDDRRAFSVLSEEEATSILKDNVADVIPWLVEYYGADSAIVAKAFETDWITLNDVRVRYGDDDPFIDVVRDKLEEHVSEFLQQETGATIEGKFIILEEYNIENIAKYMFGSNAETAAKMMTGDGDYDHDGWSNEDLDNHFDTLKYVKYVPDPNDPSKPHIKQSVINYDMKPVYARYIREHKMEEWKDFTNSDEYDDYDPEDDEFERDEDERIIYPPERENVDQLKSFLYNNDEEWEQAFRWSYNDAYGQAVEADYVKTFTDAINDWEDEFSEKLAMFFVVKEGEEYTPAITQYYDRTFFVAIYLDEYLKGLKFRLKGIIQSSTDEDDIDDEDDIEEGEIDYNAIKTFISVDEEEFTHYENNISKRDIRVDGYHSIDDENLGDILFNHIPVTLEFIQECQPVKPEKK